MSVPNIITFLRIVAVPAAMYMILTGSMEWAFALFVAAGLSDALDGAIARMFRARTVLGGYLDPLADKALIVGVYVALAWVGAIPLWLAMMVVFRDIMIIGGVILVGVEPGGPAAQAGLVVGDIITTWDGETVHSVGSISERLGTDAVGKTVKLGVVRGGNAITVDVTIGERPRA